MSLSNPRTQSPVRKYFRVNAGSGTVTYYDKSISTEIVVDLPFRFIVLDALNAVGGWHEPSGSRIFSNEVRNNSDILRVKAKSGVLMEGPYADIKESLRAKGGRFALSLYVAIKDEDGLALGNLKLVGAALSEWFDYSKARNIDGNPGISITGWEPRKKGSTEFFVPTFQGLAVSPADLAAAQSLDETLQAHLNGSLSHVEEQPAFALSSTGPSADEYPDSAPF